MVRQMATTALLLVHFSDPPLLGGVAVVVWGLTPFGVLVVGLAPGGQNGCRACAYGVCGLRAARGAGGLRGA